VTKCFENDVKKEIEKRRRFFSQRFVLQSDCFQKCKLKKTLKKLK
jgi:hypothetical protein